MPTPPDTTALVSGFLLKLAARCIVAVVKKVKESSDKKKQDALNKFLNEFELSKRIRVKLEQRITTSVRQLQLSPDQIRQILSLDADSALKRVFAEQFLKGELTSEEIVNLFVAQDPGLESARSELLMLATEWLEAIDKAVAADAELSRVLNLRAHRQLRSDIARIGNNLARAELRDSQNDQLQQQRHEEIMSALASAGVGLRRSSDGTATIPESLKSQNQRRFDRARKQLVEGSVTIAETEFRSLIEDLQALRGDGGGDLLLRSYINIGSSLWEQSKHSEAFIWFNKAYELNPNDWRAKRSRAITLMGTDDEGALQLFRAVRLERPDEADAVCNEATQLKNSGRVNEAIALLEARKFHNDDYYSILALAYIGAERYAEAESAAREALKIDPQSETAQSTLAYAIALPIVHLRMRRQTLILAPTEAQHDSLLEAIALLEKAAAALRKHGRRYVLGELLSNASAFYAAVGACDEAIAAATEALTIRQDDPMVLTNLWCVQMRQKRFDDAVKTASLLEKTADPVDGWERKAEALFLANRTQEILDEWNAKQSDKAFNDTSDVLSVVARALSDRHRTAEGLDLLNAALTRHAARARLLSERAFLMETMGKFPESKADFDAAEKTATAEERGQLLLDYGMFLFRRTDWKAAAERFKELGAESIHNPLFPNYLICLYNQGEYRRSIELAEKAIAGLRTFNEDCFEIAARCHHICDNLSRARELLDALVARGTTRELQHRKLLAWTCWRLDEVPQAYDVLLKGLKLNADDVEALILMSAVCSNLRKQNESVEYAVRAIRLAPDNFRAHAALVTSMFSAPPDFKPQQEHLDAHFRSLNFLQHHESGILRAIPVEPDLHSILEMVKERSQQVQKLEDHFHNQQVPMGLFATHAGSSLFQLWAGLLGHRKLRVRMAFGTAEEQELEMNAARTAASISVDFFALLTLKHLKLLHILPKLFATIYAHSSLLDAVVEDIRQIQQHPVGGTMAYVNGKFVMAERTLEQSQQIVSFLAEIRDFLKSPTVKLTGLLPDALNTDQRAILSEKCGLVSISPILVAAEKGAVCFSDDAIIRAIGRLESRTPGFSTQALLRVALGKAAISQTEYEEAIITLIESNYSFVSEDVGTLWRAYERGNGRFTPLATAIINRVADAHYNASSCLPLLAEFSARVWISQTPAGGNSREEWVGAIWRALVKCGKDELLLEFVGKLAVACSRYPAVFAGIVNFGIMHITELSQHRTLLFFTTQEAMKTMQRLTREFHPLLPTLPDDWRLQARMNLLLQRQGLLQLV